MKLRIGALETLLRSGVEVDLGAPATITEIRLRTSQSPTGETMHRVLVRGEDGDFSVVHQFSQFTGDGDWLIFEPETPLEDVRILRVETLNSPSWVSWFEIQAFGTRRGNSNIVCSRPAGTAQGKGNAMGPKRAKHRGRQSRHTQRVPPGRRRNGQYLLATIAYYGPDDKVPKDRGWDPPI